MKTGSVTVDSKSRVRVRANVASAGLMLCGCTEFLQNQGLSKSTLLQLVNRVYDEAAARAAQKKEEGADGDGDGKNGGAGAAGTGSDEAGDGSDGAAGGVA